MNKKSEKEIELENLEEQVKEKLSEAYNQYIKDEIGEIPPLDLSFFEKDKKSKHRMIRIERIAVCIVVLFLTSSAMTVWINSEAAHAVKFKMQKVFHEIGTENFSTDEREDSNFSEDKMSITIDSMENIDDALNFVPKLIIPEYIPTGFQLKELSIDKFVDGTFTTKYSFKNKNDEYFYITSFFIFDKAEAYLSDVKETIVLKDRTIYYIEDAYTKTFTISFILDDQLIGLDGDISRDEILKISENIQIHNKL